MINSPLLPASFHRGRTRVHEVNAAGRFAPWNPTSSKALTLDRGRRRGVAADHTIAIFAAELILLLFSAACWAKA
jgi:hypothetical protein